MKKERKRQERNKKFVPEPFNVFRYAVSVSQGFPRFPQKVVKSMDIHPIQLFKGIRMDAMGGENMNLIPGMDPSDGKIPDEFAVDFVPRKFLSASRVNGRDDENLHGDLDGFMERLLSLKHHENHERKDTRIASWRFRKF